MLKFAIVRESFPEIFTQIKSHKQRHQLKNKAPEK